jgi:hypothetical protein
MADDIYFDGDPETDSARRHLERLLKEDKPRRKWPWIAAGLAGAAAWYFWPRAAAPAPPAAPDTGASSTGTPSTGAQKRRSS